jgi:hypothetical protein
LGNNLEYGGLTPLSFGVPRYAASIFSSAQEANFKLTDPKRRQAGALKIA